MAQTSAIRTLWMGGFVNQPRPAKPAAKDVVVGGACRMSAGPTQTNKIQSPEAFVSASHVIYGGPRDRYLRLFRALIGIDEHIHTYAAKSDQERREVRFDTNGKPLRDWDD